MRARLLLLVLLAGPGCDEQPAARPGDLHAVDRGAPREAGPGRELGAGDLPATADAAPPLTTTFTPTTLELPNPERGFYAFGSDLAKLTASELQEVRDVKGLRLLYAPTLLAAYRTTPLPKSYLDTLTGKLALVRAQGMKLVLRFAYNYDAGGEDATLSMVEQHIAQLGPLLKANADVIAYLQAGFIGAWGEWHSSSNGLASDANKAAIRDALLAAAPAGQPVQFRYPPDLIKWYPTVLDASQAFGTTAQARIAAHNDCFLSSNTDVGTYSSNTTLGNQQRAYIKALTVYTPYGGETCDAGSASEQRRSCSAILAEGRDYHLTYLNLSYYQAFHDRWKAEGCYDEVARSLGYRFQLDAVTHPAAVARGATLSVQVALRNLGWSRIVGARQLHARLRQRASGALIESSAGPALRMLPPQATASTTVVAAITIPASAASGEHDLLLCAPDVHPTTAADGRFSVRFANQDVPAKDQAWEPGAACFRVGARILVN